MWCSPALAFAPSDLLSFASIAGAGAGASSSSTAAAAAGASDPYADVASSAAAASECSIAAARSANASQDGDTLHACLAIADRPVSDCPLPPCSVTARSDLVAMVYICIQIAMLATFYYRYYI
ncbi:hypothetical protein GQ55_3G139400 [Panicum hallii var. hallii]|uniref:Uncharacterized protein n=1 Tax=Panicum hallii var. hallii TaxID=1504633 RepID=A0A2T7E969_9POAL|nr:hypothetical protein GQ55_3G139400 [Panicum hallii var. hallii]